MSVSPRLQRSGPTIALDLRLVGPLPNLAVPTSRVANGVSEAEIRRQKDRVGNKQVIEWLAGWMTWSLSRYSMLMQAAGGGMAYLDLIIRYCCL